MKRTLLLLVIIFALLASCKKETNSRPAEPAPTLAGQWKMVLYIDSTTNVTETKADSYLHQNLFMASTPYPPIGDVVMKIAFNDVTESTGIIEGSTIFNGFTINFSRPGNYSLATAENTWTLASDPPWGFYFYSVIQSVNSYGFDSDSTLYLKAPTKTLVFSRE